MKTLIFALLSTLALSPIHAGSIDNYESPFSYRYGSPEMRELFSMQRKFSTWREIWVALAEAEQEVGLAISDSQIDEMRGQIHHIDFALADQLEKKFKHDVMAHVHTYGIACPSAKPIIHLGATSCVVTDNADVMMIRDALGLVENKLLSVIKNLALQADKYKDLPCLSYTHFQSAQPTTVGKRFTMWLQDLVIGLREVRSRRSQIRCLGLKGATGTQSSFLELLNGNPQEVEELENRFVSKLGFENAFLIAGQTYTRIQDVQVLSALADVAIAAHKMSTDMRLLAHDKEIEEPFSDKQVGSSAMPYKRNPIDLEKICSLARVVFAQTQILQTNAANQWLERTLDDSANRRVAIPEAFLALDTILDSLLRLTAHWVIYPEMIEKNLRDELPFMATENILMAAVKKGGDRQVIHERLRELSQKAGNQVKQGQDNPLLEWIADDAEIPLTREELSAIVNVRHFIGCAPLQVAQFLEQLRIEGIY